MDRQRTCFRERKHVAARKILEHDVVKRGAREIDGGAVSKPIDDVRVTNAVECDRFVLKIRNECFFEFRVRSVLKIEIQGFDDDALRRACGCCVVVAT